MAGSGACDIGSSDRPDAHDGPLRLATCHLRKASVVVHGLRAEPHVFVAGTTGLVDRIGFDQRGSPRLGVGNGSLEERLCNTLAAVLGRHDEADDGPDGLVIHWLHHGRAFEPGVLLAWTDGDPADGDLAAIADEAGWSAGIDESLEAGAVRLGPGHSRWRWLAFAAETISHAPAATSDRAPFGIEDRLEVEPAICRERSDGELHRTCLRRA